jgi:hypothetical protein
MLARGAGEEGETEMNRRQDDRDETIADGFSIRVPLMALDATQRAIADRAYRLRRPGPRTLADAAAVITIEGRALTERERAYDAMVQRGEAAWRTPTQRAEQVERDAETGRVLAAADGEQDLMRRVQAIRDQAYDAMVRRGEQAWRNP